ncbi:PKD domain-containing protein [Marinicella sediminis]|uniref:PKD domain-containing protein n=1 Tax=Marinicella sediminis TaxID=1792834 RepID=A0ABV7J9C0_9GAMM|nr:PKD domain-containing protein [Marinicella sediminis]
MNKLTLLAALTISGCGLLHTDSVRAAENRQSDIGGLEVSAQLFDVIEQWQMGYATTVSLEDLLMNEHTDLFDQWLLQVEEQLGGRTIIHYFKQQHPEFYDSARIDLSTEVNANLLMHWAAVSAPQTLLDWQQSQLAPKGLDLSNWLRTHEPAVLNQYRQAAALPTSHNRYGQFADYLTASKPSAELRGEGQRLLNHYANRGAGDHCACDVVTTFQESGYSVNINPNVEEHNWLGNLKRKRYVKQVKNKAAHSADMVRYIQHAANDVSRIDTSYLRTRTTILCLSGSGGQCESGSCTGELDLQAEYGSKVWVKTSAAGGPLSASRSLASDSGMLTYDPPGPVSEQTLFNKGVVLSRAQDTTFNTDSFVTFLEGALGIAALIATDGATLADLEFDLVDKTVKGLLGLISHNGNDGENHENFYVDFDSNTAAPYLLNSEETHTFELTSKGQVYSRGWGGNKSWSWGRYNSAYWLAGAVKNFSCDDGVIPPDRTGFWSYASAGGPLSNGTMVGNINAFLATELGYTGTAASGSSTGTLTMNDPKYPIADCDITPNFSLGPVTSTFDGTDSFDPDGSIVSYEWTLSGTPTGSGSIITEYFPPVTYMTGYPVTLTVTDNSGLSTTTSCDTVRICAATGCVARPYPQAYKISL